MDVQGLQSSIGYAIKNRNQAQQPNLIQKSEPLKSKNVDQEKDEREKEAEMVLSKSEQTFFEQLYPESQNEIRAHHTYRRDGARISINTGTVVDRKG